MAHKEVLLSKSSSKRLIFCFTLTTKHQHKRKLHSSAQLFAVTSSASHFYAYLSTTCDKVPQYSQVLVTLMANCFVVFYYLHGNFVYCIIRLLFCMKFFTYCRFPNIFIHMVSSKSFLFMPKQWPGSGLDSSQLFKLSYLALIFIFFNAEGISTL